MMELQAPDTKRIRTEALLVEWCGGHFHLLLKSSIPAAGSAEAPKRYPI